MGRLQNVWAYQASKAGVESLRRTFAVSCGSKGIRFNCIAPGSMSALMKGAAAEVRKASGGSEGMAKMNPTGRLVDAEEIGSAAAFLCTDAAVSITGVVLPVDGGLRAT